jgi:DNA-binding transcriptional LysR family regulator
MIQAGQMVLFARVVEAGSFAAAAKSLGQTRAAVSKQIGSLETRIGAQLLQRTTRTMHLTEIGAEFYARCARIAEAAEDAERAVASLQGVPRGSLRIAAPVTFGRRYLAPLVAGFAARFPEVAIDLCLSDAPTDVARDGFDVAIRIAPRADASLASRCLAPSPHVVCASPAYFSRHGRPLVPEDLREHNCLVYSSLSTPRLWRFQQGHSVRVSGSFAVNHGESLRQAIVDGLGVGYMPIFIVGDDLAAGRLVTALDGWVKSAQKIHLMYPRNRNLVPQIRVFVEFLIEHFQPGPTWAAAAQPAELRA